MDSPNSQNNHYIPEWVLKKFRSPNLFELNIHTRLTKQRNPGRAGSGQDLWPKDIEDQLSVHDNAAARIFRNKIDGKESIVLSGAEKMEFARWLSQFGTRVPKIREDFRQMLEEEVRNPEVIKKVVKDKKHQLLAFAERDNPEIFQSLTEDLGRDEAERWILEGCVKLIANSPRFHPMPESIHHFYLRNNGSEKFAKLLCEYNWNWLRTEDAFVIGDNSLVRWREKSKSWDCGIKRSGVEITMPLTLKLSLRLTKSVRRNPYQVKCCNAEQTRIFNERQRVAAIKCVYGHCAQLLNSILTPVHYAGIPSSGTQGPLRRSGVDRG